MKFGRNGVRYEKVYVQKDGSFW